MPGSTDLVGLGNSLPVYKNALGIKPPKDYPENADFGMLTRIHQYVGKVWYQREILIPEKWKISYVDLFIERVLWRSRVWIDGRPLSKPVDFLSTPHIHNLGIVSPGKHIITVEIDNSEIYPVGILAHDYDNHTQTVWNGMVGEITLTLKPPMSFQNVRIFPSFENKNIKFDIALTNSSEHTQVPVVSLIIKNKKSGTIVTKRIVKITAVTDSSRHQFDVQLKKAPLPWDEFSPELYTANVTIKNGKYEDHYIADFDFRDISTKEKHLAINDRKLFVCFSNESMFFPQTGFRKSM